MATESREGLLERLFHLKEHGTTVKTEFIAGITTFMTMAYILAVNPGILSAAGMDRGAVFTATALASMLASILMAALANYPFVLSAGMGLNAYFAYTVVLQMGYTWQMALAAVFAEGILFIVLSLTNVREAIFNAIPLCLKRAVSTGIGLFIAFLGLQNAKIVVDSATLVTIYPLKSSIDNGTFRTEGITVVLAILGILITAFFMVKNIQGSILWGILATWILGIICELTGLYTPDPANGIYSVLPDLSAGFSIPSMAPTFLKIDFSRVVSLEFLTVMFAFLFVDMFDTLGTLIGVASKANMLDKDGRLPKVRGALMADAVGTCAGALFGTSTITTFVESASGVAAGGRTGLTSVVSGILFGLSLFLSPIFLAIPSFATAPALVAVGFLMISSILQLNFSDYTEAIPCYICIIAMPFTYSISEGISFGIISYVVINLLSGKAKEKNINPLMYVLAVLFILKYFLL